MHVRFRDGKKVISLTVFIEVNRLGLVFPYQRLKRLRE